MKSADTPRGFTLVEIMIVVAFIAMLAALAIPSFQRVSRNAQDIAVRNNARQLSAALDQYFLENSTATALLGDVMGSTKYLKQFRALAGESYPASFTQGEPFTITGIGGNRTLTYNP